MPTITIELTETQYKGLEYAATSPEDWAANAVTERARIANEEIIKVYMERALDEGVQMPTSREEIVADAFARGWVKTANQINEEAGAEAPVV